MVYQRYVTQASGQALQISAYVGTCVADFPNDITPMLASS